MAQMTGPAAPDAAGKDSEAGRVHPAARFRGRQAARRGLLAAFTAAVAAGVSVAGYQIGASHAGRQHPAATADAPSTAPIVSTTLVSTDSEPGTLGYAQPRTLEAATSGIVTELPQQGTVIHRDQRQQGGGQQSIGQPGPTGGAGPTPCRGSHVTTVTAGRSSG